MPAKTTLSDGINKYAKRWATLLTKKAKALAPNTHIRRAIRSKTTNESNGAVRITISVGSPGRPVPDARAYEKESGIHSLGKRKSKFQQGVKGKILIQPRSDNPSQLLYFPFSKVTVATPRGRKFKGFSQRGIPKFKFVEHPGVMAANGGKGYMRPALASMRRQIKKELAQIVKNTLVVEIRSIMNLAGKK